MNWFLNMKTKNKVLISFILMAIPIGFVGGFGILRTLREFRVCFFVLHLHYEECHTHK